MFENELLDDSRRKALKTLGAGIATATLAGCTTILEDDTSAPSGGEAASSDEDLRERLETLEERETELENKLADAEAEHQSLEDELAEERERREELAAIVDGDGPNPVELQEEIDTLEATIEELEQQLEEEQRFSQETLDKAYELGSNAREAIFEVEHGTGFHIGDGYILTNQHVVDDISNGIVRSYAKQQSKREVYNYELVGMPDNEDDVALISIPDSNYPALEFGDPMELEEGEPVISVGHPANTGKYIILIGRHEELQAEYHNDHPQYQQTTSIIASGGASGSPILNMDGEVVSILYASTGLGDEYAPDEVHLEPTHDAVATVGVSSIIIEDYLDDWM